MATAEPRPGPAGENLEAVRDEWLARLEALVSDVEGWAQASGWRTRRGTKTLRERRLGAYQVPVLFLEKDTVEVVLNPIARFVPGALGAVDLYVAPAYDDIASLYFEEDRWVVYYGERTDPLATQGPVEIKPQRYDQQAINSILGRMLANG